MEAAVFIARIFGVFYLVVAAGMALNRKFYQKVMEDYPHNPALILFSGIFALVTGVVIVLVHNVWVANWTVVITIIGWMAILKGTWLVIFPSTVSKFMKIYKKNSNLLLVHSAIAFILGLFLTYLGYFAG
ncbi:MAG: hypothetical protein PHP46_04875 [Candidatus Omnitrophica bacterium]|nr:hypothetical protein [Candidatus Omnitrophota bacterium]